MKTLIAEDDPLLSSILANSIRTAGIEVVCAYDGEEAIEKVRSIMPDVILLDILMPKKDGFAVLEEMKSDPSLSHIRVIVLSNVAESGEVDRARTYGVLDYLVKANTTPDVIAEKVKSVQI